MSSFLLQNFPNLFGQPLVCLLSPDQVPSNMQGETMSSLWLCLWHNICGEDVWKLLLLIVIEATKKDASHYLRH